MKKKVAIAVDSSQQSFEAAGYAAMMAESLPDITYVLLNIHPSISQYLVEEAPKSAKSQRALDKIIQLNQEAAQRTCDKLGRRMRDLGVDVGCIETKTLPKQVGVAEDILSLCQTDTYDAVIVGRRGVSRLQKWVMGSVTNNLVEHSQLIPVWVVDGAVTSPKILIAVDGSQGALRALDHLCFMICGAKQPRIEMVHVRPKLADYCDIALDPEATQHLEEILDKGDRRCIDDFHAQAAQTLKKHGFTSEQIHMRPLDGQFSIAQVIVDEAAKGEFGTLVVGRRGTARSLFTGSVSRKVLQKASNSAVWIVP